MRIVQRWSIAVRKEFGLYGEDHSKTKWILYKNENVPCVEMTITELRELKKFFDSWVDPFQIGNPKHNDKLK